MKRNSSLSAGRIVKLQKEYRGVEPGIREDPNANPPE